MSKSTLLVNMGFILLAVNSTSIYAAECGGGSLCLSIDNILLAEASSSADSADSNPDSAESDNSKLAGDVDEGEDGAKTKTQYPLLKSGSLDTLTDEQKSNNRVWPHKLPFLAQMVIDKGFDLPNPYGVAGIYAYVKQDVDLSDLRIGLNTSGGDTQVPFVTFQNVDTTNQSVQVKLDAWLFPFLNVFAMVGKIDGSTTVPINIPGQETLDALLPTLGALCSRPADFPGRPALCDKDIVILDKTEYSGNSYRAGFILPIGWGNYFIAIPISYVYSDLSNADSSIKVFQASLRGGYHWAPSKGQMFTVYGGATYLDSEQDVSGSVRATDPDLPGGGIDIGYTIHQTPADKVNYLVGFNWTITRRWWLQAEVGFGGQREDLISSINYRW